MIIVININIIILRIIIIITISVIVTINIFIYLFIYLFIHSFIYYYFFFPYIVMLVGSVYNRTVYGGSKAPIRLSGRGKSCLVHTKPGMFGLGIVPKEIHSRLFNPVSN